MARRRWLEDRDNGRFGDWWRRLRRAFWSRIHRLNAPVVYPWFVAAKAGGAEAELHRIAAGLVRRRVRTVRAHTWHWLKSLAWPLVVAGVIPVAIGRYGRDVRKRFGLSLQTQFCDVMRAAFRHGIFPMEFYHRRVFCEPGRRHLERFLGEREMIELTRAVQCGGNTSRVSDPLRFLSECRACGFAIPRTIAFFRHGELELRFTRGSMLLPEKDVMVRTADGRSERWSWNPLSRQWRSRGVLRGGRALFEDCRLASRSGPVMVQEALNNHPEMARFSTGGLVIVRMATVVADGENVMPLFAAMRMPASPANDFMAAGSLESAIAIDSGALSHAMGDFISDGEFDLHPETGAVITGGVVPHWDEMLDLVARAHRQFHDVPFIEWRLCLAGNGPVILEAGCECTAFPEALPAATRWADFCLRRLAAFRQAPAAVSSPEPAVLPRAA